MAMALDYLHKQKIIYRDLKTENVLLGEDGYIMIIDFGISKYLTEGDEVTKSYCGTPEYLAPEVIQRIDYSYPIDWWCIGIITYEMLVGFTPFYSSNESAKARDK